MTKRISSQPKTKTKKPKKEKPIKDQDDKQIVNAMGYGHAFIYGLVEGVTEFLPISSTGHLVLVREYLSSEEKNKEALNAYLIVIQAGAILAVTLIYRKQVLSMILGFLGLSNFISFVLKRYYDLTISLLTGFVMGSLLIIWPWKIASEIIEGRNGEIKVVSYDWLFPETLNIENILSLLLIFSGILLVWGIEYLGSKLNSKTIA